MSASSSPSEPGTTPDEYRQRALLWADLGRYDDAAEELGAGLDIAPEDATLLTTLARVHLAADQPTEALTAAEHAVQAAADTLDPMVVRAMALTDSRRYADAAQVATAILRRWPDDPYAQRTGAGLLGESRNGQEALNAAWHGVRVAPADAEAHLVLAVVAARLRLFDLAQRAYGEALDLDEAIGDAQHDVGVVRFERRRWARALESLADEASLAPPASSSPPASPGKPSPGEPSPGEPGYPSPFPRPYDGPDAAGTAAVGDAPDMDPHPRPRRLFGRRAGDPEPGVSGWSGFFGTPGRGSAGTGAGGSGGDVLPGAAAAGSGVPGAGAAGTGAPGPSTAGADRARSGAAGSGVPESGVPVAAGGGVSRSGKTSGVGSGGRGVDGGTPPGISRPVGPVLDPSGRSADVVRAAVLYGANGTLVAAVLTAGMTVASSGASRVWGGMVGAIVLVALLVWLNRRLPEPLGTALGRLRRSPARVLAVAAWVMFGGPVLLLVYAGVGGLVPLVAAMVVAAVAELLVLTRR